MLVTLKQPAVRTVCRSHLLVVARRRTLSASLKTPKDTTGSSAPSAAANSSSLPSSSGQQGSPTSAFIEQDVRTRLRSWTTKKVHTLRRRIDEFSTVTQATFSRLGGRLNEVTGYHEIEELKRKVVDNERKMREVREAARTTKETYEQAVARRSNSQREVNDLLQRKSMWTDADVSRFTQLVRQDHLYEQNEMKAKLAAAQADDMVDIQFNELTRSILSRYHEEQVWSDKIRSASTYGSLAALGLNLLVFVLAIVIVEPWKRKRLVQSFEARVIELNEKNQMAVEEGLRDLKDHQASQKLILAEIRAAQTAIHVPSWDGYAEPNAVAPMSDPPDDIERNSKTAKDRHLLLLSAAVSFAAGISGWLVGSQFS